MNVEVLAVGTELLLGQIVNTNAAVIGERLAESGLDHHRSCVVGDNLGRIVDALRGAIGRADAVIVTGGIGPTQDDLTRDALAAVAGVESIFDEEVAERLRHYWESRGREMPASNITQAYRPEGSVFVDNPIGTAPGIRMEIDGTWVFALPGVPVEMRAMLDASVLPFLVARAGGDGVLVSRVLRTWGDSESKIAERLGDLFETATNPTLAFLASSGEIKLRLTAKAATEEQARRLIAPLEEEIRRRLGSRIFGVDDETIEKVLLDMLVARELTIGTAESATGGMVAARITSVPGSSHAYRGSVVAYQVDLKERLLGVPAATIETHGVVSEEVAAAMAAGARRLLEVDVAVGITGSAGPEPQDKPVGTMVVAVATPEGTRTRTLHMPPDRERARTFTATAALHLTRLSLEGVEWGTPR